MLKIRLQRVGRKHEPTFRVVLTDSRNSTKSGRLLEVLGSYDPRGKRGAQGLKKERISYLISKGAQPTGSIHNLLIKNGILTGKKIHVARMKRKEEEKGGGEAVKNVAKPSEEKKEEVTTESSEQAAA